MHCSEMVYGITPFTDSSRIDLALESRLTEMFNTAPVIYRKHISLVVQARETLPKIGATQWRLFWKLAQNAYDSS